MIANLYFPCRRINDPEGIQDIWFSDETGFRIRYTDEVYATSKILCEMFHISRATFFRISTSVKKERRGLRIFYNYRDLCKVYHDKRSYGYRKLVRKDKELMRAIAFAFRALAAGSGVPFSGENDEFGIVRLSLNETTPA
jgi:hypothetical protein